MKVLENKKVELQSGKTDYKGLIDIALNHTPKNGFDFDDMYKRHKIKVVIDASEDEMLFEGDVAEDLKKICKECRWGAWDVQIKEFGDAVENMKDVKPLKKAK